MINFDLLAEELKDINKNPHNIHYSNIRNLIDILKDGYLEGSYYDVSLKRDNPEIATLRRSEDKKISLLRKNNPKKYDDIMFHLSESIDDVKIYLFTDRIRSSVRKIKKYPISEYNISDNETVEKNTKELYEKYEIYPKVNYNTFKKEIIEICKSFLKNADEEKRISFQHEKEDEIKKILKEKYGIKNYIFDKYSYVFFDIVFSLKRLRKSYNNREGEERFKYDAKKSKGIPVNPNFMKIRILKLYPEKIEDYKELINYINKTPSLFIQDKVLHDIKKLVKNDR